MVSNDGWRPTVKFDTIGEQSHNTIGEQSYKALFIILSLCLVGCPDVDWEAEVERISKEDAFNRCNPKDRMDGLPDGTVCREALCTPNGASYSPRGVCIYNGNLDATYCSPVQPVVIWCAAIESCEAVHENSQGMQAICKVRR